MDPQSASFTPQNDVWRIHSDMLRIQQTQDQHAERLRQLERRQEEESRPKSIWGTTSPFPSVLSGGTPQQGPIRPPVADVFSGFDDQSANLIGSLHLDPEDEPRRTGGATSRANSVRFDESANQGHWSHASRSSFDLIPRTGSSHSLGGHAMSERSYSHKSDARSVHSATSGRANSLGMDNVYGLSRTSPAETPGLTPGLFILGSVPAIIRCWLNTNFKHDSLLYAAVCTGSYTSYLDLRLIDRLGFQDKVTDNGLGDRKITLDVYLPEATQYPASSRSSSPAPQLPSLTVEFTVVEKPDDEDDSKAIQIFLGSDTLRAHSADILFSTNMLTMFDDDRSKLSIPLVRPEDERTFKTLHVTSGSVPTAVTNGHAGPHEKQVLPPLSSIRTPQSAIGTGRPDSSHAPSSDPHPATSGSDSVAASVSTEATTPSTTLAPPPGLSARPSLGPLNTHGSTEGSVQSSSSPAAPPSATATRTNSQTGIWGNWRRDPSTTQTAPTAPSTNAYQRKDTGIKVLKPTKLATRTFSAQTGSSSPSAQQSRFFDDGRRRVSGESEVGLRGGGGIPPSTEKSTSQTRENQPQSTLGRTKSANPLGGGSAFAWLNAADRAS